MHRMIYHMEFAILVALVHFFQQPVQLEHNPLVQFFHILERYGVGFIVEIGNVAQQITEGIAHFAVCFADLL